MKGGDTDDAVADDDDGGDADADADATVVSLPSTEANGDGDACPPGQSLSRHISPMKMVHAGLCATRGGHRHSCCCSLPLLFFGSLVGRIQK